ncbi:hypothetical protein I6A60_07590 [Frankia sp. AgB1.9]|uniref:hypothetical protein n=1 Tax=unclassified Frankia TaxID=2632575 RepID=UPI0019316B38|nr:MULTISPECIES: hypothetical protein [unclassified Frankia]MBL7490724.1 hypothetical protein [Frankia sp. AgW1.1]MBL7547734.1 hypothetical protein [Frankia sp. AgB1.9]MBL7622625.1 hypothetical protein [Frankia sp. AgB1.8]
MLGSCEAGFFVTADPGKRDVQVKVLIDCTAEEIDVCGGTDRQLQPRWAAHNPAHLWAVLWLPDRLRRAWDEKFPALAESSRITAAA